MDRFFPDCFRGGFGKAHLLRGYERVYRHHELHLRFGTNRIRDIARLNGGIGSMAGSDEDWRTGGDGGAVL